MVILRNPSGSGQWSCKQWKSKGASFNVMVVVVSSKVAILEPKWRQEMVVTADGRDVRLVLM